MDVKPVKQKTVVFQVMEQLKEMIAAGSLQPKQKVPNEYQLAEMFGVGRSSIREALKIFQYLGIVEIKNPKGTYIGESSNISSEALVWSMLLGHKDFSELIELRMVLEQQGLWYLLEYKKNDHTLREHVLAQLQVEIENMRTAIQTDSITNRLTADYNFHGHIIHTCENNIFTNLYKTMEQFMVREIQTSQVDVKNLQAIPQNHEKLLQTIVEGDYQAACNKFRHHIKNIDTLLDEKLHH